MSEEKKKQIIALGQLGWSLRRIEKATGVRRETAAEYLKAVGIAVRPPGAWGKRAPAKPAAGVTADSASACEPYRELIEHGVTRGRNAMAIWQELARLSQLTTKNGDLSFETDVSTFVSAPDSSEPL